MDPPGWKFTPITNSGGFFELMKTFFPSTKFSPPRDQKVVWLFSRNSSYHSFLFFDDPPSFPNEYELPFPPLHRYCPSFVWRTPPLQTDPMSGTFPLFFRKEKMEQFLFFLCPFPHIVVTPFICRLILSFTYWLRVLRNLLIPLNCETELCLPP